MPVVAGEEAEATRESRAARSSDHLSRYSADVGDELQHARLNTAFLRAVGRIPVLSAAWTATRNQIRAAELLGVNRNTLRRRFRDLEYR